MGAVGAVPVPVNGMVCGLPEALSVKAMVPVRVPVVVGVNVTPTVHDRPAPKEDEQVFVAMAKSPVRTTEVMFSEALPMLVNVRFCAALVTPTVVEPKVKLVGEMLAIGAGADTPFPVRVTACGEPAASSVKVSAPDLAPRAEGVKVTFTVQLTDCARVAPHVVEALVKSPVATMEAMFMVAFPVLFRVTT